MLVVCMCVCVCVCIYSLFFDDLNSVFALQQTALLFDVLNQI